MIEYQSISNRSKIRMIANLKNVRGYARILKGLDNRIILQNGLFDNLVAGKLQEQLLGAHIAERNGGLGVLASAFDLHHIADSKALVLNDIALVKRRKRSC